MRIDIDGVKLITRSESQKNVFKYGINTDKFESTFKEWLKQEIKHRYSIAFDLFKKEWDPKLIDNEIAMIPLDKNSYASLVFSQPNYKDYKSRELEAAKQGKI